MSKRIESGKTERENLKQLLAMARAEDLGPGDVTSSLLAADAHAIGKFVVREPIVACGLVFLDEIARAYDPHIQTSLLAKDGELIPAGAEIASWSGPIVSMLAAERVALNFMQRLSGIATLTRTYVTAVEGTDAKIYDTRKTTPGWRHLEKYAVRAGGGCNHRMGLYDAVLIKDNHLAILSADQREAMMKMGDLLSDSSARFTKCDFVELEVDTLEQFAVALNMPVDVILLDNMSADLMTAAVEMRNAAGLTGRVALEASGGITLDNLRIAALTGVERIAVGAITHSATAVDIALELKTAGTRN